MRLVWLLTVLAVTMVYTTEGAGSLVAISVDEKKEESRIKLVKKSQHEVAEFDMSSSDIATEKLSEGQLKINKIISALRRLPDTELERLNVDIKSNDNIQEGSESAVKLIAAWEQRQKELKDAMKDMLNAAQYMKSIANVLSDDNISNTEKQASLRELEGLLCDIDNARDFHTIGGWPALAACLSPAYPADTQALAAWAIGSAVKNSYDYQLWLLVGIVSTYEKQQHQETVNELFQEVLKKAIYAVSAAARGNVDVQNSLQAVSDRTDDVDMDRNGLIWSFVYDMLEERRYIREVLPVTVSNTDMAILDSLPIIGDSLMGEKWANLAVFVLFKYFQEFSALKDSNLSPKNFYEKVKPSVVNLLTAIDAALQGEDSEVCADILEERFIGLRTAHTKVRLRVKPTSMGSGGRMIVPGSLPLKAGTLPDI
eukprot:gene33291-43046_t